MKTEAGAAARPEVWFYHLEHTAPERTVAELAEKVLARGWRAVVCVDGPERMAQLDDALWAGRGDDTSAVIPHGRADEAHADRQPILISCDNAPLNGAQVLMVLDSAPLDLSLPFIRVILLFDGQNADVVGLARQRWAMLKAEGHKLVYWQNSPHGGWQKKADA